MTKEQKIKLHTAMLSDNEHRCNSLNNYIHTDEYLTAEVVKVVEEIVVEATKKLQEENERLRKGGCRLVNCNGRENGIELRKAKIKIEQLEKQVAKLKLDRECLHCVYTDSPCTPHDYDKNEIGYCSKYESIYSAIDKAYSEKANAEIKLDEAKNIIHKLLILINDRHWWNYQTIDEARFFMKE